MFVFKIYWIKQVFIIVYLENEYKKDSRSKDK